MNKKGLDIMKRIVAVLLMIVMVIPLTGCRSGKNEPLQKEVEQLEETAKKEAK